MKAVAGSTPVTAVPLTLACWWQPVSATVANPIFGISNSGGDAFYLSQNSSSKILATTTHPSILASATTSTSVTAGAWCHVCGSFTSSTSRAAYLNGGGKGTNGTVQTPSGLTQIEVGHTTVSGGSYANGNIAECAIWNIVLTDNDVADLANGIPAWMIRPDALVFYAPLLHGYSPEIELIGANNLTLTNSPTVVAHPAIFYRQGMLRG